MDLPYMDLRYMDQIDVYSTCKENSPWTRNFLTLDRASMREMDSVVLLLVRDEQVVLACTAR
jgi:hypothetical protein